MTAETDKRDKELLLTRQERWDRVREQRAKGMTLDEIAKLENLTRQRIFYILKGERPEVLRGRRPKKVPVEA